MSLDGIADNIDTTVLTVRRGTLAYGVYAFTFTVTMDTDPTDGALVQSSATTYMEVRTKSHCLELNGNAPEIRGKFHPCKAGECQSPVH